MRKLLYMLSAICLLLGAINTIGAASAQDAEMVDSSKTCTIPRDNDPIADTDKGWKYCNIHTRRFAYREKHIELKEMLAARAANYRESSQWAKDQYKEELEKLHGSLGNN